MQHLCPATMCDPVEVVIGVAVEHTMVAEVLAGGRVRPQNRVALVQSQFLNGAHFVAIAASDSLAQVSKAHQSAMSLSSIQCRAIRVRRSTIT